MFHFSLDFNENVKDKNSDLGIIRLKISEPVKYEPTHEKTCFFFANAKIKTQISYDKAQPLIFASSLVSMTKISCLWLASAAVQVGLSLT